MGVCCCSLAGTFACQHCSNNSMAMSADNIPIEAYKNYGSAFVIQGPKPMTNADRIRSMTYEKMASILTDDFCELICSSPVACNGDCEAKMFEWLKQEAT